ncbi:MAG: hypothetical protein Q8Q20_01640 [bacterium]|nr:hypothetical protein [bacterium]
MRSWSFLIVFMSLLEIAIATSGCGQNHLDDEINEANLVASRDFVRYPREHLDTGRYPVVLVRNMVQDPPDEFMTNFAVWQDCDSCWVILDDSSTMFQLYYAWGPYGPQCRGKLLLAYNRHMGQCLFMTYRFEITDEVLFGLQEVMKTDAPDPHRLNSTARLLTSQRVQVELPLRIMRIPITSVSHRVTRDGNYDEYALTEGRFLTLRPGDKLYWHNKPIQPGIEVVQIDSVMTVGDHSSRVRTLTDPARPEPLYGWEHLSGEADRIWLVRRDTPYPI